MPSVRFKPLHGQDSVTVPDVVDGSGNAIFFGIEGEHVERELSDADAAIILSNPNFVDAKSGKNPNFGEIEKPSPAPVPPPRVATPPAAVAASPEVSP
jgi:ABC-type metal ion transport system substrate-binding protein